MIRIRGVEVCYKYYLISYIGSSYPQKSKLTMVKKRRSSLIYNLPPPQLPITKCVLGKFNYPFGQAVGQVSLG